MTRAVLLAVAIAVAVVGVNRVGPQPEAGPDFGTVDAAEPDGAVPTRSTWYCPWVEAGDIVDTDILVTTDVDVDVKVTLLDPLTNQAPTISEFSIVGPGAGVLDTGGALRRGESPAVVEVSDGPAAAASLSYANALLSGDRCAVSVPKIWYLTGGTTKVGSFTELRLFNPFADNADVTVIAYSEFGVDVISDLESFDVPPRSWTTIDMEKYLPFRDELVLAVTTSEGTVIPVMVRTDDRGQAMWPGSAPSKTWDFPIVSTGGLEPSIAVFVVGDEPVLVTIDIMTEQGPIRNAREVTIDPKSTGLIQLSDLASTPFGVRVRASDFIAASVVSVVPPEDTDGGEGELPEDEPATSSTDGSTTTSSVPVETFIRGLAGTTGIANPASKWIVPLDTFPDNQTTVWVLNAGSEAVTVEFHPLGEVDFTGDEQVIIVEPGSIAGVVVDVGIGIFGFRIDATGPVSVAWEISGSSGAALISGIPDL